MVRQHHCPNGYETEQTLGDSEGQGSLACCSPWGHRESDTTATEQQKNALLTDAKAEVPILWPPNAKSRLIGKAPDAGKD